MRHSLLTPKMVWIAIGATLAFLPFPLFFATGLIGGDEAIGAGLIAMLGSLLMTIFMFCTCKAFRTHGRTVVWPILGGVFSSFLLITMLVWTALGGGIYNSMSFYRVSGLTVMGTVTALFFVVLAVIYAMYGKQTSGGWLAGASLLVLAGISVAISVIIESQSWVYQMNTTYWTECRCVDMLKSSSFDAVRWLALIFSATTVAGFWWMLGRSAKLDSAVLKAAEEAEAPIFGQPVQEAQRQPLREPATQPIQEPVQNTGGQSDRQCGSIPADNADLQSLTDTELSHIIANRAIYAPDYVEAARTLLGRRQAWEAIHDWSDEQLFEVAHSTDGRFNDDAREVAATELYTRQSPLLINELKALTPEQLQGLADGSIPALEGYSNAARAILDANV